MFSNLQNGPLACFMKTTQSSAITTTFPNPGSCSKIKPTKSKSSSLKVLTTNTLWFPVACMLFAEKKWIKIAYLQSKNLPSLSPSNKKNKLLPNSNSDKSVTKYTHPKTRSSSKPKIFKNTRLFSTKNATKRNQKTRLSASGFSCLAVLKLINDAWKEFTKS